MQFNKAYYWLNQGERRQLLLVKLKQPMTAKQLARKTAMSLDCCSYTLWELSVYEMVYCLNQQAIRSRLYWLTNLGKACQRKLREAQALLPFDYDLPCIDWDLYGWVCFSHRAAVIRAIDRPMQPAAIKRKAKSQNPNLKMSANNVRDVIKLFLQRGVVRPVKIKRKAHPRYELTEIGRQLQQLLSQAETYC